MGDTLEISIGTSDLNTPEGSMEEQANNPVPSPDATPVAEPKPNERPAGLPEKFKSWDDMAKAYSDLEKKLGGKPDAKAKGAENKAATPKPGQITPEIKADAEAEKAAEGAVKDLDLTPYQEEFAKNGKISEESFKKLEKAGVPRAMAQTYVDGIAALQERTANQIYDTVGGKDKFTEMARWAAANWSKDELDAYDQAVTSNAGSAKLAVQALQAAYVKSNGQEPKKLVGGSGSNDGADVFSSMQELSKAQRDPRYKDGDPAYHAYIKAKLARSNI